MPKKLDLSKQRRITKGYWNLFYKNNKNNILKYGVKAQYKYGKYFSYNREIIKEECITISEDQLTFAMLYFDEKLGVPFEYYLRDRIYGTISHFFSDHYKRRKKANVSLSNDVTLNNNVLVLDKRNDFLSHDLKDLLDKLNHIERKIIIYSFFDRMTLKDIGERMNMWHTEIHKIKYDALNKLRSMI